MQGTARIGSGLRARTGWTRARRRRQWAPTAADALAVGCCGVGGTAGSGTDARNERGLRNDDGSQGIGRARRTTVVQGRNTGRRRLEGGSRQGRLRGV